MVPVIGVDTGEAIMDGITIIITTILAMDGVEVTGEVADMDGRVLTIILVEPKLEEGVVLIIQAIVLL